MRPTAAGVLVSQSGGERNGGAIGELHCCEGSEQRPGSGIAVDDRLQGVLKEIAEGIAEASLESFVDGLGRNIDAQLCGGVSQIVEAGERFLPVTEDEGGEERRGREFAAASDQGFRGGKRLGDGTEKVLQRRGELSKDSHAGTSLFLVRLC